MRDWPFQDNIYIFAENLQEFNVICRRLCADFEIRRRPIQVWDHNLDNVLRGRREHMLIFFINHPKAKGMLHFANSIMRGNITAIPLLPVEKLTG